MIKGFLALLLISLSSLGICFARTPGVRDHLTALEADRVRDAQILDKRIEVFIKCIDRRWLTFTDPKAADSAQVKKDLELWGELPKGSRAELLMDIAKIFDEASTNIDDAYSRDPKSGLIPKSLRKLAEAARKYMPLLEGLKTGSETRAESNAIDRALENAAMIVDALNRLSPGAADKPKPQAQAAIISSREIVANLLASLVVAHTGGRERHHGQSVLPRRRG